MERIDANSEKLGVPRILLMENAGRAIAEHLKNHFKTLAGKKIVVVAGTGNNGGDGFVAARHLAGYGAKITVILLGLDVKTSEAATNWRALKSMTKTVRLIARSDAGFEEELERSILDADIVVDAIFGTGIKGLLKPPQSTAIDLINRSKAYAVAVDIPSGLDPLTGEVHDRAVAADTTVTFHRVKTGLLKRSDLTGEVILAPIGVPPEAEEGVLEK
ncbi:MAG: NAD(P)H-hydrate epimerase [Thaumarchaeota archaeon]|nr:NAD(P)H-hydrate epimerase [Nitrososphaerota archaeon]MCL5317960.1 NAD(P)H-hydrate epimerase [Nitrososphaerota archaeon]